MTFFPWGLSFSPENYLSKNFSRLVPSLYHFFLGGLGPWDLRTVKIPRNQDVDHLLIQILWGNIIQQKVKPEMSHMESKANIKQNLDDFCFVGYIFWLLRVTILSIFLCGVEISSSKNVSWIIMHYILYAYI